MTSIRRRRFIKAVSCVAGLVNLRRASAQGSTQIPADRVGPGIDRVAPSSSNSTAAAVRQAQAFRTRQACALQQSQRPLAKHVKNGDEKVLRARVGNFTKGMP